MYVSCIYLFIHLFLLLLLFILHCLISTLFSSSWCQGLAAACDCGSALTFLFTFLLSALSNTCNLLR